MDKPTTDQYYNAVNWPTHDPLYEATEPKHVLWCMVIERHGCRKCYPPPIAVQDLLSQCFQNPQETSYLHATSRASGAITVQVVMRRRLSGRIPPITIPLTFNAMNDVKLFILPEVRCRNVVLHFHQHVYDLCWCYECVLGMYASCASLNRFLCAVKFARL